MTAGAGDLLAKELGARVEDDEAGAAALTAVFRINCVADIAWDSTHGRLLLLSCSGEVKIATLDEMKEKKVIDLTSIGSIIRDVETFHYRAFTDSLYYSDNQGDAWSSQDRFCQDSLRHCQAHQREQREAHGQPRDFQQGDRAVFSCRRPEEAK